MFHHRASKRRRKASFGIEIEMEKRRIITYIDGFSVYHGLTKGTHFRWLDLLKISEKIFGDFNIIKVKLFAGYSRSFPEDEKAPARQSIYFKALKENPKIEIHTSKYNPQIRYLPLASDLKKGVINKVKVKSYQEKGADVNLSIQMVIDSIYEDIDCLGIFTNDTDFVEPIRYIRNVQRKDVYLVPTIRNNYRYANMDLIKSATNKYFINEKLLSECQLEKNIKTNEGLDIRIPKEWE